MQAMAPAIAGYLAAFEPELRQRAAFRRYFERPGKNGLTVETGPYYSMFNIGPYTLSPWKVVWNRMGHRLAAAVVGCHEGKPIIPQETHCFFPVASETEAHYLASLLNSRLAEEALSSVGQTGGKSFATPSSIHRLALKAFDEHELLHQQLAAAGRQAAREAEAPGHPLPTQSTTEKIHCLAAEYWR
jgi:hypothetical protein